MLNDGDFRKGWNSFHDGVAGGRDEVPLVPAAVGHQRDHLAGGAGVLDVDDAARGLLEGLDPLGLGVALPGDDIERPLALADRGGRLDALGRRVAQGGAGRSAEGDGHDEEADPVFHRAPLAAACRDDDDVGEMRVGHEELGAGKVEAAAQRLRGGASLPRP